MPELASKTFIRRSEEWETPKNVFECLNAEFRFELDVCATKENAKCKKYFDQESNALLQKWEGVCFMNPPWGKGIYRWVEKAYRESLDGATIVCLIPLQSCKCLRYDWDIKANEIRYVQEPVRFENRERVLARWSTVTVFKKNLLERPIYSLTSFIQGHSYNYPFELKLTRVYPA